MSGKKPPRAVQRLKQLCVTLDRETTAEIDKVAKSEGLTHSQIVREFIEWGLENRLTKTGETNARAA
jgi:predicted DNA-binding protein